MKIRGFIPKRKLRTTARRMPQRAMEDFGEPSISFGKALAVFIVLHIVAVSGIYIFNSLKARNIEQSGAAAHAVKQATPASVQPEVAMNAHHEAESVQPATRSLPRPTVAADPVKPADTPHRKIAAEADKTPVKEPAAVKDSGELYTVVKGDTPVRIARKFHVSYNQLVKINKIEDPTKLRIGQKLRIPEKNKDQ